MVYGYIQCDIIIGIYSIINVMLLFKYQCDVIMFLYIVNLISSLINEISTHGHGQLLLYNYLSLWCHIDVFKSDAMCICEGISYVDFMLVFLYEVIFKHDD